MIVFSHATGNQFARAALSGLEAEGLLDSFHTTLSFDNDHWLVNLAPPGLKAELARRSYGVPRAKTHTYPLRELTRIAASRLGWDFLNRHEKGWACVDAVFRDLDLSVSRYLTNRWQNNESRSQARRKADNGFMPEKLAAVYCYEDGAYHTFQAARKLGLKCIYDLPIAHWLTSRRLLEEEAERLPEWEPTLGGNRDSPEKLDRKASELSYADLIICPSQFVHRTLPPEVLSTKMCVVAEFGSPVEDCAGFMPAKSLSPGERLRVLFAGAMTQRKGLADVFAAMRLLNRRDLELVVMGAPVLPMHFYRRQYGHFTHEPPRPHKAVLELMRGCHALVLPSIVEGRALVQQEAMMCGLPIIVTANAGGEDLIHEGQTGFLVPMRNPDQIAEKIAWLADNRACLPEMSQKARLKASQLTWDGYRRKVLWSIREIVGQDIVSEKT